MRVLISQPIPESVQNAAQARFDTTLRDAGPLTTGQAAQAMADYDAILCTLGDAFQARAFDGPIRCKLLANFGVGYNHIDVDAAQAAGVAVTNTPGVVTDATADIAMTLILMACRRAGEGERMLRAGHWTGWTPTQMLGTHVTGKTVGIIGMGRIGQAVARRCHFGFGMPVRYFNRSAKAVDFPATQVATLADAMRADIVVVCVPGGASTRHLVDASALAAMPRSGVFINVARGDVVDETALITALRIGQITAAGLDVYENEPHVPDALKALENVTLLPHLGTAALEVREAMGQMALRNIIAIDEGQALPNAIS